MPSSEASYFARHDKGGLKRNPETIAGHRMPGAGDEALLQSAVSMAVQVGRENGQVIVTIEIANDQTGHHVPTDSPLRHLLLLVQATDGTGAALEHIDGPTVPTWGGVGDPGAGYYAGQPGTGYAKILKELWTNVSPTGAYWNQTVVLSDNRIPAMGSSTTSYTFTDASGPVTLHVRLLFRRAFIELVDQKSWDLADIVMEETTIRLP